MILSIKTIGADTELALLDATGAELARDDWTSGRELADQLLGRIMTLLAARDAVPGDLDGVIIFSGPGSFTSLRIGHTVANALAHTLDIPVIGRAGDGWAREATQALSTTPAGVPAMPEYGADANITRPKA